jgi:hypothetical protein
LEQYSSGLVTETPAKRGKAQAKQLRAGAVRNALIGNGWMNKLGFIADLCVDEQTITMDNFWLSSEVHVYVAG